MKIGDEVIRKGRYVVREGKIIGEVSGGYEILMRDKAIVYGNESNFQLRYEEEEEVKVPKMEILFHQVNITRDIAVGFPFPSYERALQWVEDHPREGGYYSVETIFKK